MSQPRDATSFAEIKDELIQKIDVFRETPDEIRGLLQEHERNLLVDLHNAWVREGCSFQHHANFGNLFANAVIGDGPDQARVKIFAAVLSLRAGPTNEIWTRFMSALALANPSARDKDFRDECIPKFDLEYVQSQLGRESASEFEVQLCVFSPPDPVCGLDKKIKELQTLVDNARREYKTETWTYEHDHDGVPSRKRHANTEATSNFWPDRAASNIVDGSKELLRAFYVEHCKLSAQYAKASAVEKRYKLRQAQEESNRFLAGIQARARILAILLYNRVHHEAPAWDVFIEACMGGTASSNRMLDEHLPYSFDDIDIVFLDKMRSQERDSFHDRQFSFCPLKIKRPSSDRPPSRIPLARAHMPFTRKKQCGEGASDVAVFYVDIHPGHLQDVDSDNWNLSVTQLAMKQIPFDKNANQEVKVNMLIQAQAFKHKHIVQIRGIYWLADAVLIFMEPAECNLYDFMTIHRPDPAFKDDEHDERKERLQMFTNIAGALVHLHENLEDDFKIIHFMHKDIKAENILVMRDSDGVETDKILKLTDFGLSSIKAESTSSSNRYRLTNGAPADRSSRTRLPTTAVHFAPESRDNNAVTMKSDVWAFGLGFAEVVAWIAKGSEGLEGLERERELGSAKSGQKRKPSDNTSWILDENNEPVLSPGIVTWFETLIADGDLTAGERQMYTSCWLLMKHVCLACEPERRGSMMDVQKFLRHICNGRKDVQDKILSKFPEHRAMNTQADLGSSGGVLTLSPATTISTDTSQHSRQDSAHDPLDKLARKSTSSGHSSAATGTSTKRSLDGVPQTTTSAQPERSKFKSLFGRKKPDSRDVESTPTKITRPNYSDADERRRTSSGSHHSNANRRQQAPSQAIESSVGRPRSAAHGKKTELHIAAGEGNLAQIGRLLASFDNTEQARNALNAKDENRMTPLLNALREMRTEAAILLFDNNADVDIVPNSERSALDYAVEIPPTDGGKCLPALLLERSPALVTERDQKGDTALHKLADLATKGTLKRLETMLGVLKKSDVGASVLDEALKSRSGLEQNGPLPCEMVQEGNLPRGDREKIIKLLTPGS
jgi:serine/threonine protein kinase